MSRTNVRRAGLPLAALALGLLAASGPAASHPERVREACTSDYMQYCSQYDPDGPQTRACMRRNEKRLSPACRRALFAAGHRPSDTRQSKK